MISVIWMIYNVDIFVYEIFLMVKEAQHDLDDHNSNPLALCLFSIGVFLLIGA